MVKNCDRVSPYGPTLSQQITCVFFNYKWVCLCNFVIESGGTPSTINDLLKIFATNKYLTRILLC